MKTAALLLLVFTAFSCFFTRRDCMISVRNASHERFDSIVLYIHDHKSKINGLDTGQTVYIVFPSDSLKTMHDVIYHFRAYGNDSVKAESYRTLGDYGRLPKRVDATINDTLDFIYKIEW